MTPSAETMGGTIASCQSPSGGALIEPETKPVFLIQKEGHPTVRVFEKPEPGARVVCQIPSYSDAVVFTKDMHSTSFFRVQCGDIEGWVGVKNVKMKSSCGPEKVGKICLGEEVIVDQQPVTHRGDSEASQRSTLSSLSYSQLNKTIAMETPKSASGCVAEGPPTMACRMGTKCKDRTEMHLTCVAHPFDPGYVQLCEASGIEPEEPSLLGLFTWVDKDGSSKVSLSELHEAISLLSTLVGEEVVITDNAWNQLDEDGNGCINFSEFSSWAGPRLGLPLGVKHLFSNGRAIDEFHGCAIIGCPCEAFVLKDSQPDQTDEAPWAPCTRKSTLAFVASDRGQQQLQLCTCGHKYAAHNMSLPCEGEVPYPMYWDARDSSDGEFTDLVPVDAQNLKLFQKLLDETYAPIWTRDRRKHNPTMPNVPEEFTVVRAFRSENSRIWREYGVKRAQLIQDYDTQSSAPYTCFSDVTSSVAWAEHGGLLADRLKPEINEWYLFHGCGHRAAENICKQDFRLSNAGNNTGTLYGRGIYFAESITKADEYSKPNDAGEYAVLLTRVVGGHVRYTDDLEPDPEDLVQSCIEGPYDCIIGDRRKTKGTYREFVFYDTENFYAEYIIHYTRGKQLQRRPSTSSTMSSTRSTPRADSSRLSFISSGSLDPHSGRCKSGCECSI